jgi:ATP-binding cassette, subfamily F, member 3
MDEPTNHLDKTAREALERALDHYNGTLLLISHDRYFLDRLVNRVVEIGGGTILEYDGNYSYYLQKRDAVRVDQPSAGLSGSETRFGPAEGNKPLEAAPGSSPGAKRSKEQKRWEAQARQAISRERNRLKREIAALEEKIDRLEKRKAELESQMAQPATYEKGEVAVQLQKEYAQINKELDSCTLHWEQNSNRLEDILQSIA